uniref:7TM_GPCR_Srx domain-containing protein n=1 Tax=Angiostrongylus cantonensis TaxID=6313 RepID=A0A0K0D9V9_ANGCA
MANYEYPFHDHFFVFYIFLGSILLVLNLQTMMVIRRSKSLRTLSAYRIIFFGSTADAVNCAVQVAVVAFTLRAPVIHPTLNSFMGALYQTMYAMEYPTILVLAFNRFIAVVFPKKMDFIFDEKKTMIILILCCLFGAFNGALCLSGEIRLLWDPSIPSLYYTNESSFTANFMRDMDFYFGEIMFTTSLIIYVIITVFLLCNVPTTHQISPRRNSTPVALLPDIHVLGNLALYMVLSCF